MFGNYIDAFQDSVKERVKLRERIQRLRNQFETFNAVQDELALIDNFDEAENERQTTTDQFDDIMTNAIVLLERFERSATPSPQLPIDPMLRGSPAPSSSMLSLPVHLPKIDLPKFDGRIETWVTFKDAFNTLIHVQPGLSRIQKLHYLKLSLSGRAEDAIAAFTITEDNYDAAWNHLSEIYDNKRALVLRHAALLRDTPAMSDDSSEAIRDLANHMQLHIRSLQALGRSREDIANDLLSSIVISKMGPDTRRTWERTLNNTEVPKLDDIFKYLHNASHQTKEYQAATVKPRSHQLPENITPRSTPPRSYNLRSRAPPSHNRQQVFVTNKPSPSTSPIIQARQSTATANVESASSRTKRFVAENDCKICFGQHAAYRCPKFIEMEVVQRIEAAKKARLCMNCLRSDHPTENCSFGNCRVCNQAHNTKLHQDTQPTSATRI
ncbi:uncharacterized protein LOC123988478 [Osmia bicornis bicornis]|uniref:uncharacterized protein LOC114881373 n=1 Tax=Osmia bicornis bicornis TaxID=1437191 RepID=UPI001EAEA047|nr:uncharacterized protein LOC114881373 [Osmia bicornis bicornis]XP_046144682.1 uncharacterized protein LOC123988478 [Osmia bicornis bicornis]